MSVCNATRCLVGFCVVLTVTCVALISVLVWRETSDTDDESETTYISTVTTNYRGFFRTSAEQNEYASKFYANFYSNRKPVNTTIAPKAYTGKQCSFRCNEAPQRKRRQLGQQIFHGCCASSVGFIAPPTYPNSNGVVRTLVQFTTVQQYFAVHTCNTIATCTGCLCSQEQNLFTAVVVKPGVEEPEGIDDTEVDFLLIDGCCKCVNI